MTPTIPKVRGPLEPPEQETPQQEEAEHSQPGPGGESCGECYYFSGENMCKRYPQAVQKAPSDWSGEFRAKSSQSEYQEPAQQSAPQPRS